MTDNTNIWLNGIMGVVVGDALGCPVQFDSREECSCTVRKQATENKR